MDLFEEVIKLRREGKRGVMATIVHTNGSIPSFESSRMLVQGRRHDPRAPSAAAASKRKSGRRPRTC